MKDKRLRDIFAKYDMDHSQSINVSELKHALHDLGVDSGPAAITKLVSELDKDGSGELDYAEFVQLFGEANLQKTFSEIDVDGNGHIDVSELHQATRSLGFNVPQAQICLLLKKVDTDASGTVSYEEFRHFFQYVPAASLANVARVWLSDTAIDCGSDLAPPVTSPHVPWYYGVFGGIGGIVSRTLTAPLERVKLVAQTSSRPVSIFAELRSTHRALGVRGLFAGNGTNCARVFPYAGIVTYIYLSALQWTPADAELDRYEPLYRGGCAAFAGCVGQLATYPLDVIRTRMTVGGGGVSGVLSSGQGIYKTEGVRALYRGLAPTLLAVAPFLACQMVVADTGKALCADLEVTPLVMLGVSATAGACAQTIVYPLDVLRRRLQMGAAGGSGSRDSTWRALQHVVRREGVRSLFAGILPTYAKVLPAVALAMTTTKTLIGFSQQE